MIIYVDSSAIVKPFLNERGSDEIALFFNEALDNGDSLCTAIIAETEVRRTAKKTDIPLEFADKVLAEFTIIPLSHANYRWAGAIGANGAKDYLRSLDAIHIIAAQVCKADKVITFDERQASSFKSEGFELLAIGGSYA
ncbi:hypothetical protein AGMMS49982_05620 [Bacteroidia bacterium]|nr:hypothetical protein AGMMS49982_05620 [Bacteroidia bacterium]